MLFEVKISGVCFWEQGLAQVVGYVLQITDDLSDRELREQSITNILTNTLKLKSFDPDVI